MGKELTTEGTEDTETRKVGRVSIILRVAKFVVPPSGGLRAKTA
jgi:hypothetical protein